MTPPADAASPHLDGLLSGFLKRRRLSRLRRFIPAGARILDVGCGDASLLAMIPAPALYVGLDTRQDAVTRNQERLGRNGVSFIRADFPAFDWPGLRFDRIVLAAVLEHLESLEAALDKLEALAGRDALLLVTTPAPAAHAVLRAGAAVRLFARESLAEHKHYYRRSDFVGLPRWRLASYSRFELGLNQRIVLSRRAEVP